MGASAECVLVTGGAGFIGGALVRSLLRDTAFDVVNLDALTYAADRDAVAEFAADPRYLLAEGDIADGAFVRQVFERHRPIGVYHLAAESHVDRSIDAPAAFMNTNITGTFTLLTEARRHAEWSAAADLPFRFVHVSTDEVFGSLGPEGRFTDGTPYAPRSPYAASKASSDHLVRAWAHTYGLPCIVVNCSNNYGPRQFPEKLIPLMILSGLEERPLPVYGDGGNVRDWLHVEDHVAALRLVLERGRVGETYLVGGDGERTNLEVVRAICALLDARLGRTGAAATERLITFVADRPGHDRRYAIDASKVRRELGWAPRVTFEEGLASTVDWYLENREWWQRIRSGTYRLERLGLGTAR
jgi:dTDP-glucose 4,6-dehydratase